MPDPFGAGTVALLPLTYDDGAVASVLRVESPGVLGDDDEALLHSATSLASQALGRVRRSASPMWADGDYASDLPTARWWRDAVADVFRDAAAHRMPVSLVAVEVDLRTVDAQAGAPAADARLLAVVDAWRRLSIDLIAPLGTEVLVALLPGRAAREAQALVAKAHAEFVDPLLLRCAVAEWDGTESGDELLMRARAAVRRDPSSASG
ncbi:MAG: hypothetical protein JHD16_06075 [Solirubrobacteraceae bacterium]|nr:hypothetical protein [Solirubrobacteraceae bacterium]